MRAKPMRAVIAALGASVALAAAIVSAAPAYAAPSLSASPTGSAPSTPSTSSPSGSVFAVVNDIVVGVDGGPGKLYPMFAVEAGDLTNVRLSLDLSQIDGIATASFPNDPNCTITGTTATCDLPDSTGGPDGSASIASVALRLVPAAGAVDGVKKSIKLSLTATGADSVNGVVPVAVKDGPDLVVTSDQTETGTTPGAAATFPFAFANLGTQPASGVSGIFEFTHGFVPNTYDNCTYLTDAAFTGGTLVFCDFVDTLDVNAAVTADFGGHMTNDAAATEWGLGLVETGADLQGAGGFPGAVKGLGAGRGFKHRSQSGKTLTLKPAAKPSIQATDIDQSDNGAINLWDVKTSHDAQAVGATLTGQVGATVTTKIGLKDNGPASLSLPIISASPLAEVLVTVPAYAKVTKAPDVCLGANSKTGFDTSDHWGEAGFRYYRCEDNGDFIPVGGSSLFKFTFKLTADHGTNGSVEISADSLAGDGDSDGTNNTAPITGQVAAQPELPTTGIKVGLIAGGGALLVLLGAGFALLGRRRKRAA